MMINIANVATTPALIDGDDGFAMATTRVVNSVSAAFQRNEVD
jgi:2-methylisocitrate lyase-like PEP mutase family enzyme